jgi:DNA-binding LacI/PurR family transcriptional regulator
MEPRRGNLKVNFREIARELEISVMTLYRVVNQSPQVGAATRARVTEALNRHGYFVHRKARRTRVLFDFCDHPYLRRMGEELIRKLPRNEFRCASAEHRKAREAFLNAAADSDIVVFCSIPDDSVVAAVRSVNPDVYTVAVTTESAADVTVTPNNKQGGELVARHLHSLGHDHIAVFLSETHPTRMERYKSFRGEMAVLDPACRIDVIAHSAGENTAEACERYFARIGTLPGVIFFPAGGFAQEFQEQLVEKDPERFRRLGIMSYDRPEDLSGHPEELHRFDRIEFVPREILDWAEYYITNRPMMKKRSPIHTCVNSYLVREGSVANKKDNGNG